MSEYPEHDKMSEIKEDAQIIGDFLDWLTNRDDGVVLARYQGDDRVATSITDFERLIYEYFEIDRSKIEAEKEQMLEKLRADHAAAGMLP